MEEFDDSIEDLLSEGDSFFEDPKTLAKKSTPKKSSKTVSDIFGLDLENKPNPVPTKAQVKDDDWLGLNISKNEKDSKIDKVPDTKTKKIENKLSFEKDDVENILGLSAPEPKAVAVKKSSILSDILGETKQEEKPFTLDDILQSSRKKEPIQENKPNVSIQNEFGSTFSRESRRGRRNSPIIPDPLGIFDSQKKDPIPEPIKDEPKVEILEKKVIEDNKSAQSSLPNWLGEKSNLVPEQKSTTIEPEKIKPQKVEEKEKLPDHMLETLLTQQKISSSHIELQNASLALQQQESQLMIAVQLKKYEENLAEMQRKQQEMLLKQDIQFNSLLERQFAKQQIMENNMRLQQERINNHIQLLLSQPASNIAVSEEQERKSDYIKNTFEENRKFYDDIVNSLKQKHHEEIFLLEESYKKQLTFLENSLESTESRLKSEIESINKHFLEKLEESNKDRQELVMKYEERIKQIHEQNLQEIETIKENSKITISDIRCEYKQMIDDIAKGKTKEQETMFEADTITKKIDENLEILQGSTKAIHDIQTKFNSNQKFLTEIKLESLAAKEEEIKLMKESLEKQRTASDVERAQLLTLVRTLETRVAEQTQSTREESWALQQATTTLVAKSQALEREADFMRKNLERERAQVKTMKETLLAEHEKIMLQLTEEKLAVAAEKSRLETSAKLNKNFDTSKAKTEIEAALKVAKEATELTDRERENLCKLQCEIEIHKRNLQDRETKLMVKEQELDKLFKIADLKYRDGEKALQEAKLTEHKYTERLKDIQKQLMSLAAREKKLTEEKIAMSKDRVALHNQMKDNKKCGLCEVDNFKNDYNEYKTENVTEQNIPVWGADADILRLKYDLENETVVSREHSVMENNFVT